MNLRCSNQIYMPSKPKYNVLPDYFNKLRRYGINQEEVENMIHVQKVKRVYPDFLESDYHKERDTRRRYNYFNNNYYFQDEDSIDDSYNAKRNLRSESSTSQRKNHQKSENDKISSDKHKRKRRSQSAVSRKIKGKKDHKSTEEEYYLPTKHQHRTVKLIRKHQKSSKLKSIGIQSDSISKNDSLNSLQSEIEDKNNSCVVFDYHQKPFKSSEYCKEDDSTSTFSLQNMKSDNELIKSLSSSSHQKEKILNNKNKINRNKSQQKTPKQTNERNKIKRSCSLSSSNVHRIKEEIDESKVKQKEAAIIDEKNQQMPKLRLSSKQQIKCNSKQKRENGKSNNIRNNENQNNLNTEMNKINVVNKRNNIKKASIDGKDLKFPKLRQFSKYQNNEDLQQKKKNNNIKNSSKENKSVDGSNKINNEKSSINQKNINNNNGKEIQNEKKNSTELEITDQNNLYIVFDCNRKPSKAFKKEESTLSLSFYHQNMKSDNELNESFLSFHQDENEVNDESLIKSRTTDLNHQSLAFEKNENKIETDKLKIINISEQTSNETKKVSKLTRSKSHQHLNRLNKKRILSNSKSLDSFKINHYRSLIHNSLSIDLKSEVEYQLVDQESLFDHHRLHCNLIIDYKSVVEHHYHLSDHQDEIKEI